LKTKRGSVWSQTVHLGLLSCVVVACVLSAESIAFAQVPVKITLDEATQMAREHNHNLLAARTTIQQSEAEEITANLRPNPVFFTDWDYLPFFSPSALTSTYLHDSTEADMGLSYLIERGKKLRNHGRNNNSPATRLPVKFRQCSRITYVRTSKL
jgi:hypothetical protein